MTTFSPTSSIAVLTLMGLASYFFSGPSFEKSVCQELTQNPPENLQYELVRRYIDHAYPGQYQLPPLDQMITSVNLNLTRNDLIYENGESFTLWQGVYYQPTKKYLDKLIQATQKLFPSLNNSNVSYSHQRCLNKNSTFEYRHDFFSILNHHIRNRANLFPHTHFHETPRVYRFCHTVDPSIFPPLPGTIWETQRGAFLVTNWNAWGHEHLPENIRGFFLSKKNENNQELLKKGEVYLGKDFIKRNILEDTLLVQDIKNHHSYAKSIERTNLIQILNADTRSTRFSFLPATFPKKDMETLYKFPCFEMSQGHNYLFSDLIHKLWHSSPDGYQGMRIFTASSVTAEKTDEKKCFPFEEKHAINGPLKGC